MYNIGDAVFHPTNGAGVILELERMPALNLGVRFYRIQMLGNNDTVIRVPVSKADALGLRPALSEDKVERVLDVLSSKPQELAESHTTRYKECQARLDTGETEAIAALIRDLNWRQIVATKLNAPAHRMFKSAMRLLAGELAISQDASIQAAEEQIRNALKQTIQIV